MGYGDATIDDNLTVGGSESAIGNLGIYADYMKFWNANLTTEDKVHFEIGKNDVDEAGSFWFEYAYPNEMLLKFNNGNAMIRMLNAQHLTTIFTEVEMERKLTVKGNLDVGGDANITGKLTVNDNEVAMKDHTHEEFDHDVEVNGDLTVSKSLNVGGDAGVAGNLTISGENLTVNNFYVHAIGTDYVDFSVGPGIFLIYSATTNTLHTGTKFTASNAEIYNSLKVDKDVEIIGTLTIENKEFSPKTVYTKDEVYTKAEVDAMLSERFAALEARIAELEKQQIGG